MTAEAATGVPQVDVLLQPVPDGAALLLMNDPGVEAEPFLYQAAATHLAAGRRVVYVVTNRAPSSVVAAMRALGFAVDGQPGRLLFVDAFSSLMGSSEGAAYSVDDPQDPEAFGRVLADVADEHPGAVVLVDSLSTLADSAPPDAFAAALPRIVGALKRFRFAAALFTKWPYAEDPARTLTGFDALVTLRGVEQRVVFSQYFAVDRADWKESVDSNPRLFKVQRPGGVVVYIPKIIVTGPYNAGKSTFIHSASDAAVSVDRMGTTVALDHGRVTMNGLVADVFGTPGQARFDPILRMVANHALGVVLVVDATKPDSFDRARDMLDQTWRQGIPAIVAANKQDVPEALTPAEVAERLRPPDGIQVVGCAGQDRDASRAVLKRLIDQILAGGIKR